MYQCNKATQKLISYDDVKKNIKETYAYGTKEEIKQEKIN